ncbi:MAG: phage shock protein PspA [Candidatus Sumerlaeia bacterium]
MGIFTRLRDIVSANLNAMLDKAEDPEKMVRMMIQEMEDTLVEVKSSCAAVMADQKKQERQLAGTRAEIDAWDARARLAVQKGREDLARAALVEKQRYAERARVLEDEMAKTRQAVTDFQEDIAQLEKKLADAREKQRSIIHRRTAAMARRDAQSRIRAIDTSEAFAKFEAYENGIDRLEAEAGLVDSLRPKTPSLREEFNQLEHADEIEQELQRIKNEGKQA